MTTQNEEPVQATEQTATPQLKLPKSPLQLVSIFDSKMNRMSLGFAPRGSVTEDSIVAKISYLTFDELLADLFVVMRHVNQSHGDAGFAKGAAHVQAEIMRQHQHRVEAAEQAKREAETEAQNKKQDQSQADTTASAEPTTETGTPQPNEEQLLQSKPETKEINQ